MLYQQGCRNNQLFRRSIHYPLSNDDGGDDEMRIPVATGSTILTHNPSNYVHPNLAFLKDQHKFISKYISLTMRLPVMERSLNSNEESLRRISKDSWSQKQKFTKSYRVTKLFFGMLINVYSYVCTIHNFRLGKTALNAAWGSWAAAVHLPS